MLPAREILLALAKSIGLAVPDGASLRSTVFEDNNGCLTLATVPKMTPRTKHIGVKYFWFRSKVGPGSGINIQKVDTKDQLADTFTKGLAADQFATLRTQLMGWSCSVREGVSANQHLAHFVRSLVDRYVAARPDAKSVTSGGVALGHATDSSWWKMETFEPSTSRGGSIGRNLSRSDL